MGKVFVIESGYISLDSILKVWKSGIPLEISESVRMVVGDSRKRLEELIGSNAEPVYGVNTGFGSLCDQVISDQDLERLQYNLVRSHACGTGAPISEEITRLVLILKILSLSKGNSAVRPETLDFLVELYNRRLTPVIPRFGSLGASGDLAPLAHLTLPLIGEGMIWQDNQPADAAALLQKNNLTPCGLRAKEGLALLNGTQFSLALLTTSLSEARDCMKISAFVAALSMEAFDCSLDFLHPEIHRLRNQPGQVKVATQIREILKDSGLKTRSKASVQDPYSFRCVPQVHGATLDAMEYVWSVAEREANSVTDNPLLLSDGSVRSGGNFHAQPLALGADFLSISMAEIGNISERRIYQLINGSRGLPVFLTQNPGLNSGYMIVQYSAAALVSNNKQLASPSSVDSIVTSKGQEDHVSMAANAGLRCLELVRHVAQVLAMEWMTAARAWHYRENWSLQGALSDWLAPYLSLIPFQEEDHIPSVQFQPTLEFLRNQATLHED
jgi:histidine ammonia-lyase